MTKLTAVSSSCSKKLSRSQSSSHSSSSGGHVGRDCYPVSSLASCSSHSVPGPTSLPVTTPSSHTAGSIPHTGHRTLHSATYSRQHKKAFIRCFRYLGGSVQNKGLAAKNLLF